jgi:hypothetical protein
VLRCQIIATVTVKQKHLNALNYVQYVSLRPGITCRNGMTESLCSKCDKTGYVESCDATVLHSGDAVST